MKLALFSALAGTAAAAYSPGATGLRTYAPGVNPPAHQRPVAEGADPAKVETLIGQLVPEYARPAADDDPAAAVRD